MKQLTKRLLSLVLVLLMLVNTTALAADSTAAPSQELFFTQTEGSGTPDPGAWADADDAEGAALYADTDIVRVSIVLKKASTLEAGYAFRSIGSNTQATRYRVGLEREQTAVADRISRQVLNGQKLDVVWNLTLAANVISANVAYGDVEKIKDVSGVEQVVLETRYLPAVLDTQETADPMMATSGSMIGTSAVWAQGYTGAGSRVAVIDTGLDLAHQSFDAAAFEYSLAQNAAAKDLSYEDYLADLGLLDAIQVENALDSLHLNANGVTAQQLYRSSKIPFAFNYVDETLDVTHENDTAGEHGSHVSGIAAANAYLPQEDGSFVSALESVKVQGVAPDAQLLVMKVFGQNGGAYDSDYMAAIEDAILLGCDSINLSLGSSYAGFACNTLYQSLLDSLTEYGAVITMSAGNSGNWAQNAENLGYLYSDDVNLDNVGAPSSFTSSLSVASADNAGFTGNYFTVNGQNVLYAETLTGERAMTTLAGEQEYVFLDGIGSAAEFANAGTALQGRIAVCYRGTTSFLEKASRAASAGAIGTIVGNNEAGMFYMDLSNYNYAAPCVSISRADALALKTNAEPVTDEEGNILYYLGKLTVAEGITSQISGSSYTMSSFSSWGVPGSLELKPEITAPGGSIYSANGYHGTATGEMAGGHDAYETMSGTSMAAPQVAGMAAVLAQCLRENGLTEKSGLGQRQLIQSLLMSTAEPVRDAENGSAPYSLLQQGAGLANVGSAAAARSYLQMNEDATTSWADGKIKAELGDDPQRSGQYQFSFTLNNLTDEVRNYTFSSEFFTQAVFSAANEQESGSPQRLYLDTKTAPLGASIRYTVDGQEYVLHSPYDCDLDKDGDTDADDAQLILSYAAGLTDSIDPIADVSGDGTVDTYDAHLLLNSLTTDLFPLPAGGSVEIGVTVTLTEEAKAAMDASTPNGAYVEGYVSVEPVTTEEGEIPDATHSVPVLGFYGDWADASMFDRQSTAGYAYGESILPYTGYNYTNNLIIRHRGSNQQYWKFGNPYVLDPQYMPERTAVQSTDTLYAYNFTLIRSAEVLALVVTDSSGSILYQDELIRNVPASFYYSYTGEWQYTGQNYPIGKIVRSLGMAENEQFTVSLVALPEYTAGHAMIDREFAALVSSGELGKGSLLSTTLTVDDTAPELLSASKNLEDGELILKIRDNQFLALAQVTNLAGSVIYGQAITTQSSAGDEAYLEVSVPADEIGPKCKVSLVDYAGNTSVYEINYGGEPEDYTGKMYGFITGYRNNSGSGKRWLEIDPANVTDRTGAILACSMADVLPADVSAAEYVKGYVYMAAEDGNLYVAPQGDWANLKLVGPFSGTTSAISDMAYDSANDTLYAMGSDNHVYSVDPTTGALTLAFTLTITNPATTQANKLVLRTLAVDDEGTFYAANYGSAADAFLYRWTAEDIVNGAVTDLAPVGTTALGKPNFFGTMAWDHDNGLLYWASAMSFLRRSDTSGNNRLMLVNTEDGTAKESNSGTAYGSSTLNAIASGLYVVPSNSGTSTPSETATDITLDKATVTMLPGMELALKTDVYPWNLQDDSVTWTSSNESVALVDQAGYVRAAAPGSAVITATTNAQPKLTAECTVTVTEAPDIALTALIYDENGSASWQEFTTNQPLDRTVLASAESYLGGALLDDGIIVQDGRKVSRIDPDTFVVTELNPIHSDWVWTDAAPAPLTEDGAFGKLVALCSGGTQMEVLDPDKGTLNVFTYINEHLADPMAAIAYLGSADADHCTYAVITEGGELYRYELNSQGGMARSYLGSTGLALGDVNTGTVNCYASMVYDAETGYLVLASRSSGSATSLYLIDPETCLSAKVSSFEDSAWPVVSLYQYDRVTELTVRVKPMKNVIYVGDTAAFTARVLPESFDGDVTWSSADESIAAVDENGIVTGVGAGETLITATSVAVNEQGQHASASGKVVVKPLTELAVTINAQVTTKDGTYWAKVDTSDLSSFTKSSGNVTAFSGGGAHDGKLYGSDWDFNDQSTAHLYQVDPTANYQETQGTAINAASSILDLASAPTATYKATYPTAMEEQMFGEPLMLVKGQGLFFLRDFVEGSDTAGWGWSSINGASRQLGALAFKNLYNYAPYNFAEHFYALDASGILFEIRLNPMYQNGEWRWNMAANACGDTGLVFEDYTKLSMEYLHDGTVNGLLIAYSGDGMGEFYWYDLNTRSSGKLGNLAGASLVKCLYADKTLTGEGLTALEDEPFTFSEGTADTVSSTLLMECSYEEQAAPQVQETQDTLTGRLNAVSGAAADSAEPGSSVALTLTAENSTNGLIEVLYDADVLSVSSVTGAQVFFRSNDNGSGRLLFAYAAQDAVNGPIGTVTFHYDITQCPMSSSVTVKTLEDGSAKPGTEQTVSLTLRTPVPAQPTTPGTHQGCDGGAQCPSAPFQDVDPSLWYHEGIDYAVSHGLMKGVSANRFNPNGSTSRAMVVTVLYRLAGEPAVSGSAAFRDVVPGAWYEKAVIWASTNGVVNGFADGTFAPDASITRQQLAAILWRYAGSPTASGGLSAFADAAEVSAFALDAMVWAVGQDILRGDNGKLLPQAGATRAQLAAMLQRFAKVNNQ